MPVICFMWLLRCLDVACSVPGGSPCQSLTLCFGVDAVADGLDGVDALVSYCIVDMRMAAWWRKLKRSYACTFLTVPPFWSFPLAMSCANAEKKIHWNSKKFIRKRHLPLDVWLQRTQTFEIQPTRAVNDHLNALQAFYYVYKNSLYGKTTYFCKWSGIALDKFFASNHWRLNRRDWYL